MFQFIPNYQNKKVKSHEDIIKFAKVRPKAVIPSKRDEDANFDCYAHFDEDFICIGPHQTKILNLGIASAFSDKYMVMLNERGSTGTKGIKISAGIIDSKQFTSNSWSHKTG